MRDLPSVAVCGCGSAGTAIAADVSLIGCKVNLFELPEFEKSIASIRKRKGIELTGTTSSGKSNDKVIMAKHSRDPQKATVSAYDRKAEMSGKRANP